MKKQVLITLIVLAFFQSGCKKYLDIKSDKRLSVINSLDDFQSLLDHEFYINGRDLWGGELSTDDYYISDNNFTNWPDEYNRRMYSWEKDFIFRDSYNDWSNLFRVVYRANTVLDQIDKADKSERPRDFDDVKGQALFYRAHFYLQGALNFCLAYDATTADTDLGMPLRLDSDFNKPSIRSSLRQTYEQIIADLKAAIQLLPVRSIHPMRPSKPAAMGTLARAHLAMRNYEEAGRWADSCLSNYNVLIDYNDATLASPTGSYAFRRFNPEVIMVMAMDMPAMLNNTIAIIKPDLYNSYEENDLRKIVFFRDNFDGTYGFRGSYERSVGLFTGVATNEIYLIRAECRIRAGQVEAGLSDLNTLLEKRYVQGTYTPYTGLNQQDALNLVLRERRKELLMRGLRWMDIKRLNKEGANISLTRTTAGTTYTLPANDLRFALAIPEDVIATSGMIQNPR